MGANFAEGFSRGCLMFGNFVGGFLRWFGLLGLFAWVYMAANGYRLTQHPHEPVLVPIDCRAVA